MNKANFWRCSMATTWTAERRKRQSEQIQTWRPWEKSTGPKSDEGKAKVAQNSYKGGWRQQLKELRAMLREHDDKLNASALTDTGI